MNSYPAVFIADGYQHYDDRPNAQDVVDYFLNDVPEGRMARRIWA